MKSNTLKYVGKGVNNIYTVNTGINKITNVTTFIMIELFLNTLRYRTIKVIEKSNVPTIISASLLRYLFIKYCPLLKFRGA